MGKLFCVYIFGCKTKASKSKLDKGIVQQTKDQGDPCGLVETALLSSSIVVDSPDSCSSCFQASGSKDVSTDHRTSNIMQTNTSPDPELDVHLVCNVSSELARLAETGENHDNLSSWPLLSPKICRNQGACASANEASWRSDDCLGLHASILRPDSQGESADVSADGSGGLQFASNPPIFEDVVRLSDESTSCHAGNELVSLSPPYSIDGAQHLEHAIIASEKEIGTGVAGFSFSSDIAVFPSSKSDRSLVDDETLTGHISDPGAYDRDERQSMFEVSVLSSNSVTVPLYPKEPTFLRKSESDSNICKLVSSEGNVENMSAELGEPGSSPTELTFCSADKVILKRQSSSKFLDSSKRNSWWKIFMVSHRNIHREGMKQALDVVPFQGETDVKFPKPVTGYTSDICDTGHSSEHEDAIKGALKPSEMLHLGEDISAGNHFEQGPEDERSALEMGMQASYRTALWPSKEWIAFPMAESGLSRVEEWIQNIEPCDLPNEEEIPCENQKLTNEICIEEVTDVSNTMQRTIGATNMDEELANAAIRSLSPFSTVAHISGIGLREVPSLGLFNSLKTLNLSANKIVRITAGCLPRSLHTLDLSRNRIGVIEGFRELTRLRVLNLSYNRISRIGHGLANCTLIKELYLVGNKIAEVEGLHRLLKLSILDLSFNKLTTSKALGQLAANYSSLLALNLLGNPVHMNVGEEPLRKLVLSIAPHVTYLNKQPIKAVSAREVVVDSVARAAMGTTQRNSKSSATRASRRVPEARSTHQQNKSRGHRSKDPERRPGFLVSEAEPLRSSRSPTQHHHNRQHNDGRQTEKGVAKEQRRSSRPPISVHEHLLQKLAMDREIQGIHRSKSESALEEQVH